MVYLCNKIHLKRKSEVLPARQTQPEGKAKVMSWRGGYESAPVGEEAGCRGGVFWFSEPGDWNLSFQKAESSEG